MQSFRELCFDGKKEKKEKTKKKKTHKSKQRNQEKQQQQQQQNKEGMKWGDKAPCCHGCGEVRAVLQPLRWMGISTDSYTDKCTVSMRESGGYLYTGWQH